MAFWNNLLGGASSAFGGPWGAVGAGLLGSLFGGGQPQLPPEMRQLFRIQKNSALGLQNFAQSVPGSSPDETQALAQQRALLGDQQRMQTSQLFANLGGNAMTNMPDFLQNIGSQQIGQQSALTSQNLLASLQARRQALMSAAQVAQGAVGAGSQYQQQPDIGGLLAQLAQSWSYRRAMRPAGGIAGGGGGGYMMPGGGGSWNTQQTPYGSTVSTYR